MILAREKVPGARQRTPKPRVELNNLHINQSGPGCPGNEVVSVMII